MFNWIKGKWQRFWKWFIFGVLGVSIAFATTVTPPEIPVALQLKVSKDQILYDRQFIDYKYAFESLALLLFPVRNQPN